MAPTRRYDEELRSIGQALEAKDISVFELKQVADDYVIEGTPDEAGSPRSKIGRWLRRLRSGSSPKSLVLGLADVERLSQAGRAKRSESDRLPNFQNVSSFLRTIGAYLDSKGVKLIGLQKRRISLTLSYRDHAGQEQGEDRTVSSFHQLFVENCAKRGKANQTPVQSKN